MTSYTIVYDSCNARPGTLSSLNENSFKLKTILNDPDHLYLAEQLINNIIILKTVTRVLTRPEEKEGK